MQEMGAGGGGRRVQPPPQAAPPPACDCGRGSATPQPRPPGTPQQQSLWQNGPHRKGHWSTMEALVPNGGRLHPPFPPRLQPSP